MRKLEFFATNFYTSTLLSGIDEPPQNKRTLLYFSKKIFTIAKHLKNALTYYVTGIREQSQKKSEINKQSTPLIPQNRVLLPHSCQVENYAKTRLKASRVNF